MIFSARLKWYAFGFACGVALASSVCVALHLYRTTTGFFAISSASTRSMLERMQRLREIGEVVRRETQQFSIVDEIKLSTIEEAYPSLFAAPEFSRNKYSLDRAGVQAAYGADEVVIVFDPGFDRLEWMSRSRVTFWPLPLANTYQFALLSSGRVVDYDELAAWYKTNHNVIASVPSQALFCKSIEDAVAK